MASVSSAPICYMEIPAPNIEAAGAFYASIFGWRITPSNLSDKSYWEFSTGDGQLTGGLDPSIPVSAGGVLLYLKVESITDALAAVKGSGGIVVREKFDIGGGYGFSAIFKDPNGNQLGLFYLLSRHATNLRDGDDKWTLDSKLCLGRPGRLKAMA